MAPRGTKKESRQEQAKDNRARIVEAAWELFWLRGYHAASIGDIAALAKVPKGSIYNYFDSKESLLIHVLRRIKYQTETHLRLNVLAGSLSPADVVSKLLDNYEELFEPLGYSRGDPLSSRMGELTDTHPEVVAELLPIQEAWRTVVAQKIWAYATVAQIPALIDAADGLAGMIYAAIQGTLLQMKITHSAEPIAEARKTLVPMVNMYVSALATGEVKA